MSTRLCGLGYVIRQEPGPDRAVAGTTSAAAAEIAIPAIIAEAGGCGLVDQAAVGAHLRGLNRVLAVLDMSPDPSGSVDRDGPPPRPLQRFHWLHCRYPGWWEPTQQDPGDHHGTVRWRPHVRDQFAGRASGRPAARPGRKVVRTATGARLSGPVRPWGHCQASPAA
jgi:hypothetical protein